MRILLVEDEQKTGDYLKQGLSEAGYITDWVTDGLTGKHQALSEEYDLIILDVMLPGLNGWNIINDIRSSGKTMPILFLTARDQIEDRVKGLELGADDYLVKPFSIEELQMGVMDSLTVQIQRSMDYFESQLRQAPIRTILMNIESVNSQAIADQIESLMRVDVRPFSCEISSTDINQESVDFSCLGAAYAAIEGTPVVARPVK